MHNVAARLVKMNSDEFSVTAYGDSLMRAGVKLNAAYAGTGFDGSTRLATDFSSELYVIEAIQAVKTVKVGKADEIDKTVEIVKTVWAVKHILFVCFLTARFLKRNTYVNPSTTVMSF